MRLSTPHGYDFFHHGFFTGFDHYDQVGVHRGALATVGILYLLLGVVGLSMATLVTIASIMFFGVLAVIGGVVQCLQSFTSHGQRNVAAGALLGALYVLTGAVILLNPVASSMTLTLFLAGALIGLGVIRVAFFSQYRANKYWLWSVISGVLSVAVGIMIMAQWPLTGLWVIGLFVSLEM